MNTRTFDQNNQPTDKTLDKVVLKNNINYWQVPEKVSSSTDLRFIDDKFNIDMTASEELKFTYEFRDGTGKLLYEEKFSLKKGQQWKHTVAPKQGVPSGNHINRFVFEDGSVMVLQTIK